MLRASLFVVTPYHVASLRIECQNFSYVYRSRKQWECKYCELKCKDNNPYLGTKLRLLLTS